MASITLAGIRFNLASDLSQSLYFIAGDGFQIQPAGTSDATTWAAGNVRRTTQPGYSQKWSVSLQAVTPAQRRLLELPSSMGGWFGETVVGRDYNGRKFYGWWDSISVAEHSYNTECDVSLSLQTITWSEQV